MTALEARKAILADLEACGALKETEPLTHEVGTCYRCHSVIEPMVSKQWFVKMEPLAKPAIESVEKGEIKFVPDRFTKNYINWMKGGRDWCISRQLWWGHQIPAWYCDDCGETVVSKDAPCSCPKCGSTKLTQDPDTLDTWFSSALWPFSTLGWPNENAEDYKYFYPTNTLVTGYDIIGFWVSRMIFSGLAYTGKAPFDTVLIHGIVRDSQGRKMSKSLGNGIDPLEVIEQYGADALRMMLIIGSTAGNDMRYSDEKVLACRNFANKLWNASRFVQMNLPEDFEPGLPAEELLDMSDKWILSELAKSPPRPPPTLTSTSWVWPPKRSRTSSGSLLRLVYRDLQDPPERRGRSRRRCRPQGAGLCAGQGAQAAAPLHAVHHRGALSGPARQRRDHHDREVARR